MNDMSNRAEVGVVAVRVVDVREAGGKTEGATERGVVHRGLEDEESKTERDGIPGPVSISIRDDATGIRDNSRVHEVGLAAWGVALYDLWHRQNMWRQSLLEHGLSQLRSRMCF